MTIQSSNVYYCERACLDAHKADILRGIEEEKCTHILKHGHSTMNFIFYSFVPIK